MRYADRVSLVLVIALGLFSSAARAEQPATQPGGEKARVLITPFAAMNGSAESSWLGRSIQQGLVADLTVVAPGRLSSNDVEASDTATAVAAGHKSLAEFVVMGSFTMLELPTGKQVRIVGQLVDVAHESSLAGFKVTGMYADIFQLEDQIGRQVRRRLSDAGVIHIPVIAVGPSATPDSQPVEVAQAPAANEYQQAYGNPQLTIGGAGDSGYNYYYGNPYFAGGYDSTYGLGFPLFIYGGGGFRGGEGRGLGHGGFRDNGFGHEGHGSHSSGSHSAGSGHGHR